MELNNELIKYPRTYHLPFSEGAASDDKIMTPAQYQNLSQCNKFIVTEKMDGGNVTMTNKHFFARSLSSGTHLWDTPAKRLHAEIAHEIPAGWRISGESLFAQRSVGYDNLKSFFLVFGIWDGDNNLLSWDETTMWAELLNLHMVPVLYRGNDFKEALNMWKNNFYSETSEGFVIRNSEGFAYDDFRINCGKYVRANHVRTSSGWRNRDDFSKNTLIA